MNERSVVGLMVLVEAVIVAVMILTYDTQPCSDYAAIWETACQYAKGDYTAGLQPDNYMYYFNWQIGIAFFESLIIRVFGENFAVLKILNAMLVMVMNYCMYRMCKRRAGREVACYAYALSTLHMAWFLSIPQLTNHHVTILLAFLIYCLLESKSPVKWAAAGLISAILNIIRPYGIIFVLAAGCLAVYRMLKAKSGRELRSWIIGIVGFVVLYYLQTVLCNQFFRTIGANAGNITEANIPYYKFQKGLYGGGGAYLGLQEVGFDYAVYNQNMRTELIEMITRQPLTVVKFVLNKMCRYLGMFDYQFEMTYNHDVEFYTQYPVRALYSTSWFQYLVLLLLALYGLKKYKRHQVDIYSIFFIGNTLIYLFIEAFSSYRFESYVFLIYLAAYGLYGIQNRTSL